MSYASICFNPLQCYYRIGYPLHWHQWLYHHMLSVSVGFIYISRKLDLVSFIIVQCYDVHKWSSTSWPNCCIRLFADYTTSVSPFYRRIWRYCTSKMVVMYNLSSVCLRLSQLSQSSFMQYEAVCIHLTHFCCGDCANTYILSYHRHNQTGSMNHLHCFGYVMKQWYALYVFLCYHRPEISMIWCLIHCNLEKWSCRLLQFFKENICFSFHI